MRTEVRYFSRGGATKKLADAIGRAVGAEAKSVEVPLDQYADVVFLGASVYGGKPDPAVVKVNDEISYAIRVVAVEKGRDDDSLPISSF